MSQAADDAADVGAWCVRTLVLYALAECQQGTARSVGVTVAGRSFSVSDDGRGHAVDRRVADSPYLRFIYQHLDYPFAAPGTVDEPPRPAGQAAPVQLQGLGLSLLNTLCDELTVTVRKPGRGLRLVFHRGALVQEAPWPTADGATTGNTLAGMVRAALQPQAIDPAPLAGWLAAVQALHPDVALRFNGEPLPRPPGSAAQ